MSIAWFPGHMASARKKAAETMARIDVVVELLDARLPGASSNPLIERLRRDRQRPCLKILNKADLADPEATADWLRHFGNEKLVKAVALSCKRPGDVAKVPRLAATLAGCDRADNAGSGGTSGSSAGSSTSGSAGSGSTSGSTQNQKRAPGPAGSSGSSGSTGSSTSSGK